MKKSFFMFLLIGSALSISTGTFANTLYFENITHNPDAIAGVLPGMTINCHIPSSFPITLGDPGSEYVTPKYLFPDGSSGTYQCSVVANGTQYGSTWMPKIVPLGTFEMTLDLSNNTASFFNFQVRPLLQSDGLGVFDEDKNKMEHVIGTTSMTQNSFKFESKLEQ